MMSKEQFERFQQELDSLPGRSYVRPSDLLALSRPLAAVLGQAFRAGRISLSELADGLALDEFEAKRIAGSLVKKGFLRQSAEGETTYLARFGGAKTRSDESPLDIL